MRKKVILFISEFPFTAHHWTKYELDILSLYHHVIVHDVSPIISRSFRPLNSPDHKSSTTFQSILSWLQALLTLSCSSDLYILDTIQLVSPKAIFLKYLLTPFAKRILFLSVPGVAGPISTRLSSPLLVLSRLRSPTLTRPLARLALSFLVPPYLLLLYKRLFVLVTGSKTELYNNQTLNRYSVVSIPGSSWDYSNSLHRKPVNPSPHSNYGVHLDMAAPRLIQDSQVLNFKMPLSSDVWYPLLNKFFSSLEAQTASKVVVSAHPSVPPNPFPSEYLGRINYSPLSHPFTTQALVKSSKYVTTLSSASISFAVIYHKPILFITSDQAENYPLPIKQQHQYLRDSLGCLPININCYTSSDISQALKVNSHLYNQYIRDYLSLSPQTPNYEVISRFFLPAS